MEYGWLWKVDLNCSGIILEPRFDVAFQSASFALVYFRPNFRNTSEQSTQLSASRRGVT